MTTQTTTNEAAERLRSMMRLSRMQDFLPLLDEIIAAAKAEGAREAVGRIREWFVTTYKAAPTRSRIILDVLDHLDEEAAL